MSNYKATAVSGDSFNRCCLIEIRNPYQQTPKVTFTEERITTLGDRTLRDQPDAPMAVEYSASAQIALYDPVTLETLGSSFTMDEVYVILFSAYLHFAKLRDIEKGRVNGAAAAQASASGEANVTTA